MRGLIENLEQGWHIPEELDGQRREMLLNACRQIGKLAQSVAKHLEAGDDAMAWQDQAIYNALKGMKSCNGAFNGESDDE